MAAKWARLNAAVNVDDVPVHRWCRRLVQDKAPTVRTGATAWVQGNRFFVFGGMGGSGGRTVPGRPGTMAGRSAELCSLSLVESEAKWRHEKSGGLVPSARSGHTAVLLQSGEVYVYGGEGAYGGLNKRTVYGDVCAYDATRNVWRGVPMIGGPPLGLVPPPRRGHTANLLVLNQDTERECEAMLVLFGAGPDRVFGQDVLLADVQLMDIGSNEWTEVSVAGSPPSARYRHSATLMKHSGLVYVIGGLSADIVATRHAPRSAVSRSGSPAGQESNKSRGEVPTDGGRGDCGPNSTRVRQGVFASETVFALDTQRWTWRRPRLTGRGPGRLFGHTALADPNPDLHRIYVYGGRRDTLELCNDQRVYVLDTDTKTWATPTTSGVAPPPRYDAASCATTGCLIIFGGCGFGGYSDASLFQFVLSKFVPPRPKSPPVPRPVKVRIRAPARIAASSRTSSNFHRQTMRKTLSITAPAATKRRDGVTMGDNLEAAMARRLARQREAARRRRATEAREREEAEAALETDVPTTLQQGEPARSTPGHSATVLNARSKHVGKHADLPGRTSQHSDKTASDAPHDDKRWREQRGHRADYRAMRPSSAPAHTRRLTGGFGSGPIRWADGNGNDPMILARGGMSPVVVDPATNRIAATPSHSRGFAPLEGGDGLNSEGKPVRVEVMRACGAERGVMERALGLARNFVTEAPPVAPPMSNLAVPRQAIKVSGDRRTWPHTVYAAGHLLSRATSAHEGRAPRISRTGKTNHRHSHIRSGDAMGWATEATSDWCVLPGASEPSPRPGQARRASELTSMHEASASGIGSALTTRVTCGSTNPGSSSHRGPRRVTGSVLGRPGSAVRRFAAARAERAVRTGSARVRRPGSATGTAVPPPSTRKWLRPGSSPAALRTSRDRDSSVDGPAEEPRTVHGRVAAHSATETRGVERPLRMDTLNASLDDAASLSTSKSSLVGSPPLARPKASHGR